MLKHDMNVWEQNTYLNKDYYGYHLPNLEYDTKYKKIIKLSTTVPKTQKSILERMNVDEKVKMKKKKQNE